MNDMLAAAIYSGAERHNVNCTKVVVLEGEVEPYRVYCVSNERNAGQRRDNKWVAMVAFDDLQEAESWARGLSDSFPGAHYLGRGPS